MKEVLKKLISKYGINRVISTAKNIEKKRLESLPKNKEERYNKKREYYKNKVKQIKIQGEKFKNQVEEGDIIKMRGTNDEGYRLVLSTDSNILTLQKLIKVEDGFKLEDYNTRQNWDKIKEVIEKQSKNIINK